MILLLFLVLLASVSSFPLMDVRMYIARQPNICMLTTTLDSEVAQLAVTHRDTALNTILIYRHMCTILMQYAIAHAYIWEQLLPHLSSISTQSSTQC